MSYEYPQVSKIVRHPQFDAKRLSDDIAVMITTRVIGENLSVSVFFVDFLPHAIVFFTRPAAPICLPRLFPFLSTTV